MRRLSAEIEAGFFGESLPGAANFLSLALDEWELLRTATVNASRVKERALGASDVPVSETALVWARGEGLNTLSTLDRGSLHR